MAKPENKNRRLFLIGAVLIAVIVIAAVAYYFIAMAPAPKVEIKDATIGWVADFTGGLSQWGIPGKYGAQYALEKLNEVFPNGFDVGDGNRYKLKLDFQDYGGVFEEHLTATKRLMGMGVPIIISDIIFNIQPIIPDLETHHVVYFCWLDNYRGTVTASNYTFCYRNTTPQCLTGLADYITVDLKNKTYSWLGQPAPTTQEAIDYFGNATADNGGYLVANGNEWYQAGDRDFYVQLGKLKNLGTDFSYFNSATQECALMVRQAREIGWNVPIGSYTGMTEVQAAQLIGANYGPICKNLFQTEGYEANTHPDTKVRQWGSVFQTKYGQYPIDLCLWTWDQMFVVVKAMINAHSVTDGAKIRDALANMPVPYDLDEYQLTPTYPINGKMFSNRHYTMMDVQIATWTEEGCKIPVAFYVIDDETQNIIQKWYPSQDLINTLKQEFSARHPT
jgi:ABC-type branched-subunit amino acid transport system substrate-binding protein